ncbi:MAG TPA: tRNA epoxyqueuosine(34) reductase QueG [Cytophagales bacterium]|nr:tRNA epoxyqueuosine(34) reductase QueG [Cytophagales bacterium]
MDINHQYRNTQTIKSLAAELGFDFCGISKADFLEEEAPRLESWLHSNRHGKLQYMENYFDKRLDPRLLVEGARSVITVLYNYYPPEKLDTDIMISKYAYGEDYHEVIKEILSGMVFRMQEQMGNFTYRIFVDSAPVLEKAWAKRAGVGWVGKNSNLITKRQGSFFFLAEIICDLDLTYDGPIKDYCGSCTRCIEACPTDAIAEPYVVDASKCISYLTIELKEEIPLEFKGKMENWAFGCDICQDVCPWNRFSKPHAERRFTLLESLKELSTEDIAHMTEETFKKTFKGSPIKRTKFSGFIRNLNFLK